MHKFLSIFFSIILFIGFSGCSDEPDPIIEPSAVTRAVLVYMSAHNDLGNIYDQLDLDEMKQAASNGSLGGNRLIVYHCPGSGNATLKEITSKGIKVLKTYTSDMIPVEEATMEQVIADFKAIAPAEAYGLILWGHGSGWIENGIRKAPQRSYGGHQESYNRYLWMNTSTLARVLEGKGFDFLYFDCCFMASVEVVYQLRHAVRYIVASAAEIPSEGMPYDKALPFLMLDTPDLQAAAAATFAHYNAINGIDRTCTMSVINTSTLDELAAAVKDIYASTTELPSRGSIQQFASYRATDYFNKYFDLLHTLEQIADESMIDAVEKALAKVVVYKASTPYLWPSHSYQVVIDHHCGLTTFVPTSAIDLENDTYAFLDWKTDVASALF